MPLVVYYILFMDDLKTGVLAIRINEGLEDDALVALNAKSKTGKKTHTGSDYREGSLHSS